MAEKRLIDAYAIHRRITAFAASVVYRGTDSMITGKDTCNPHEYTRGYEQGVLDAVNIVGGQPTVDAVEVVRCKDCRFSELDKAARYKPIDGEAEKPVYRCFYHWNCNETVSRNHFCSHGERRIDV